MYLVFCPQQETDVSTFARLLEKRDRILFRETELLRGQKSEKSGKSRERL